MTDPSETGPQRTTVATEHRPVNQILAWTGIAAAVVFIVAVVFFSGFVIGRSTGGYHDRYWDDDRPDSGMMGPGMMGPGMGPQPDMMGPGGQWDPGQPPSPSPTPRSMPPS